MVQNKIIVITGCCGLLGKEFTKTLLAKGAIVIACDIDNAALQLFHSELKEIGLVSENNVHFNVLDITSEVEVKELITHIDKIYGRIDAIVNNAYPVNKDYGKKVEQVSMLSFNENLNMHLGGYYNCMRQFSIYFKKQGYGNVLSMSSVYGIMAPRFEIYEGTEMTMPVEYAAIKAGVISLTKYFAKYYKGNGMRFNCLCPGGNRRPNHDKRFIDKYNEYGINKGLLDKEDLLGTFIFLLSDDSKYINAQNIVVDDGWSL